jgi:hypothetical protein
MTTTNARTGRTISAGAGLGAARRASGERQLRLGREGQGAGRAGARALVRSAEVTWISARSWTPKSTFVL